MTAENLMNLLDSLTETSVYVIEEESHRLLYFNERCRNTGRGRLPWESGVMKYGRNCAPTVPLRCWGTECQTIWFVMTRSLN